MSDPTRFDTEQAKAEQVRSSAGVARSPQEVVARLDETLDKLISQHNFDDDQPACPW
jgi:hypothetical protein